MKRKLILSIAVMSLITMLCSCKDTSIPPQEEVSDNKESMITSTDNTLDSTSDSIPFSDITEARQAVIDKWVNSGKAYECAKFIEDIYKRCYWDYEISNIYYYINAKYEYDNWVEHPDYKGYRENLENATLLIDPDYSGELCEEIQAFITEIFPDGLPYNEHNEAVSQQNNYDTMTNAEKKKICEYIQKRYDYYDALEGRSTGDKYSDQIWEEVMEKYGLEEWQVTIIWSNGYLY